VILAGVPEIVFSKSKNAILNLLSGLRRGTPRGPQVLDHIGAQKQPGARHCCHFCQFQC
jgi:hypothetical protein